MKNENQQIANAAPIMLVTPIASNKKPGTVIARVGKQLCFFESDEPMPAPNVPVSVMITRCLYRKHPDGHYDFTQVMALVLRVVTDEYMLVGHHGFENEGSMCRTTAQTTLRFKNDQPDSAGLHRTLTPGRTGVYVCDNHGVDWDNAVNRTYGDGQKQTSRNPSKPGHVYVKRADMLRSGVVRAEGLVSVLDGEFSEHLQK